MNLEQEKILGINKKLFIPLFIFLLLLLNCFIKFYGIGFSSFWIDEAYSVSEAQRSLSLIFKDCATTDNPPLYFLLLHCWCKVFGISEAAARSMSAVFSICTALLIFLYAKKNIGSKAAIFISLIFSFSSQHLYYAQETRNYSLVTLLVIISAICFSKLFATGKRKIILCLTTVNILLIYTHYIAGFFIVCEGIAALLFISTNRKLFFQFLFSCALLILMLSPWLANVFNHIPEEGKFWLKKPTFYNFKGVYIDFAGNKIATVLMFAIIASGTFLLFKQNRVERKPKDIFHSVFFLVWAFVIVVTVYCIAFFRPVFLTRYLLFCSLGLYLSTGYFLFALKINKTVKAGLAIFLLVCMLFSLRLHPERDERWREAVELVKKIKTKDDIIIVSVWYTNNIFSYYYDKNIFAQYNDVEKLLRKENVFSASTMDDSYYKKLPQSKRIILVQSHSIDDDPKNTVMNTLSANAKKTTSFDFNKVQVYVFDRGVSEKK